MLQNSLVSNKADTTAPTDIVVLQQSEPDYSLDVDMDLDALLDGCEGLSLETMNEDSSDPMLSLVSSLFKALHSEN